MLRWSLIAGRLPGRTVNDVKNYWNTYMSKKPDPSCKTEMTERNPTGSATTPAPKVDVIKPQPRSFCNNNSLSHVNGLPEVYIDDSITCAVDPAAMATDEAGTSLMNSSSSVFDIEQLWSLFNEETGELD
ncbi:hypothetical protein F2Q70_00043484 [Brassica cretica]|uniref:HTH myb-type domain-containing protein n=1 Tax=Brassica cretica TaxID=69181 RepID=A0A8S9KHG6_BRACR|nr:hypothetical protein F2Q70_00043484 [Brassica cretica]